MDLDIQLGDKVIKTPKMDAHDQLLLSEGVCRQLCVISQHQDVEVWRGGKAQRTGQKGANVGKIPMVRVKLLQSVNVLPLQRLKVDVQFVSLSAKSSNTPHLLETNTALKQSSGVTLADSLVNPNANGLAKVIITIPTGFTQSIEEGTELGSATEVNLVEPISIWTIVQVVRSVKCPQRTQVFVRIGSERLLIQMV